MNSTVIFMIIPVLGLLVWILWYWFVGSKKSIQKKNDFANYLTFIKGTGYTNRVVIHIRAPKIQDAIKIEEGRDYTTKDVPDKLIYTGATVGGVTTGGFHTQKGGIAITSMKKNGKYNLCYKLIPSYEYQDNSITFIELTDSDFKKFQETRINHLITSEEKKKHYNLTGKNIVNASDLSKEAAYALKDWLSGQNI